MWKNTDVVFCSVFVNNGLVSRMELPVVVVATPTVGEGPVIGGNCHAAVISHSRNVNVHRGVWSGGYECERFCDIFRRSKSIVNVFATFRRIENLISDLANF